MPCSICNINGGAHQIGCPNQPPAVHTPSPTAPSGAPLGSFPMPYAFLDGIQYILDQHDHQRQLAKSGSPSSAPLYIPHAIIAAIHPHASCPECGPNAYRKDAAPTPAVSDAELVPWFVENAWKAGTIGWQGVLAKLREKYTISRKT